MTSLLPILHAVAIVTLLALSGCGSKPAPAPTRADETAPAGRPPGLRATTAMRMEGNIVPETLVAEVNRQVHLMDRCAGLIRKTDTAVGSLNVQVRTDARGTVADLQSPVNPEAQQCLLEGMRAWSLQDAGQGKAMLLLVIE